MFVYKRLGMKKKGSSPNFVLNRICICFRQILNPIGSNLRHDGESEFTFDDSFFSRCFSFISNSISARSCLLMYQVEIYANEMCEHLQFFVMNSLVND